LNAWFPGRGTRSSSAQPYSDHGELVAVGEPLQKLMERLYFLANHLVVILLVASLVSAILGEPINASIIALMVILSVV